MKTWLQNSSFSVQFLECGTSEVKEQRLLLRLTLPPTALYSTNTLDWVDVALVIAGV